jgi:hypothetical protein
MPMVRAASTRGMSRNEPLHALLVGGAVGICGEYGRGVYCAGVLWAPTQVKSGLRPSGLNCGPWDLDDFLVEGELECLALLADQVCLARRCGRRSILSARS